MTNECLLIYNVFELERNKHGLMRIKRREKDEKQEGEGKEEEKGRHFTVKTLVSIISSGSISEAELRLIEKSKVRKHCLAPAKTHGH